MICIVVSDDQLKKNVYCSLINETDDLTLVESFNNTFEASGFISKQTVDLVILDTQLDEIKSDKFIKAIKQVLI